MYPYHFDQSNRDIGTVKFRLTSRTWRANVDVSSLETVRSPAVMRLSGPGVAPLSRAYPRLNECRPFRPSGLSRRFATKFKDHSFSTLATKRRKNKRQAVLVANWFTKFVRGGCFVAGTKVTVYELPYSVARSRGIAKRIGDSWE